MRGVVVLLLATLAACGAPGDQAGEPKKAANRVAEVPTDPQIGLPLYPGAKLTASSAATGTAAAGGVFQMDAAGAPGDVASFYREAVRKEGWTVKTDVNAGTVRILGAVKGDENVTIEVTPRPGQPGSRVTVVRGAKRAGGAVNAPATIPAAAAIPAAKN